MIAKALDTSHAPGTWRSGVSLYLQRHAYQNAVATDLWAAVAQLTGDPQIPHKMDSWVFEPGYPLVTLTLAGPASGTHLYLNVSQRKFSNNGDSQVGDPLWWVPLWLCAGDAATLLHSCSTPIAEELWAKEATVSVPSTETSPCYKANAGGAGFYRVSYDEANWACITEAFTGFAESDRSQLVDDAFAIAGSGYLAPTVALEITKGLATEGSLSVWAAAIRYLYKYELLLRDQSEECLSNLSRFVASTISAALSVLGWEPKPGESQLDGLLRVKLLYAAVLLGDHEATVSEAKRRFWLGGSAYASELEEVVLTAAVRHGGQREWNRVLQLYRQASFASEKARCFSALASTKNVTLIQQLLEMALDQTQVRAQDTAGLVTSIAGYAEGQHLAWEFVQQNWAELNRRYTLTGTMARIVSTAGHFSTEEMLQSVTVFFEAHQAAAAQRQVRLAKEEIRGAVRWLAANSQGVCAWLHAA